MSLKSRAEQQPEKRNWMLPRRAFFVFSFLAVMTAAAWASELKGFGPIEFGMTRQEALAAIEAQSDLYELVEATPHTVKYRFSIRDGLWEFEASQHFPGNRAGDVSIRSTKAYKLSSRGDVIDTNWLTISDQLRCAAISDLLASVIKARQQGRIVDGRKKEITRLTAIKDVGEDFNFELEFNTLPYEFHSVHFDDGAVVEIDWRNEHTVFSSYDHDCRIYIHYLPANDLEIPY